MNSNLDNRRNLITLRVPGDLISTSAEALHSEINCLFSDAEPGHVRWDVFQLDLTAATMVDSVGLNLIVTLLKRVQSRNARMRISYSSQNVLRTLTFTRLDKYVELVKS